MNEPNEPSYYEVALTNRQVLVSFIILLGCVLAAFVSGVYVGYQAEPLPEESVADTPAVAEPDEVAKLEEFKFFEDQEGEDQELDKPDLSALRESKSRGDTTLAQDLGASSNTVSTPRTTPAAAPPPPVPEKNRTPPEPAAPKQTPPPATATPPPPATASPAAKPTDSDGFIIQVFSSRDEAQAKKVLTLLQSGGYQAYLSPLDQGSLIMYRVRIGPFARRDLAEKVGSDIHQKYQLETWITAAGN